MKTKYEFVHSTIRAQQLARDGKANHSIVPLINANLGNFGGGERREVSFSIGGSRPFLIQISCSLCNPHTKNRLEPATTYQHHTQTYIQPT